MEAKLEVLYKRIDNDNKTKTKDAFVVCFDEPPTHDEIHDVIDQLEKIEEPKLKGFDFCCKEKHMKEKVIMVNDEPTHVFFKKVLKYIYTKGVHPTNHVAKLAYAYVEGTHDHFHYNSVTKQLTPKILKSSLSQSGGRYKKRRN